MEEYCKAPKIRSGLFNDTFKRLERWPSHPSHPTINQSVFQDLPPRRGATFSLNCILVGDVLKQFSNTDHYALTEICAFWHSGTFKRALMQNVIQNFLGGDWFMPIDNIFATYFGGDGTTDPDDEWKTILLEFLPKENVLSSTRKGSFWNVDGTGPCGPCSTIYHYKDVRTEKYRDPLTRIKQNHRTMPEIWNFVFVKFNRGADGVLTKLLVEHVISGMNFEATTTSIKGAMCTYYTDVFTPLLDIIHSFAGNEIQRYHDYVGPDDFRGPNVVAGIGRAYRIIMDHLRMISVCTASGAQVGKQGRNTLLKFIDRHAIQLGVELLKINNYPQLVRKAIEEMAKLIPELLPTNGKLQKGRLNEIIAAERFIYKTTSTIKRQQGSHQDDDSSTSITWYKTRVIEFFDRKTHIIHKDKKKICSLVALCNALLLEGKLSFGSDIIEVSESHLLYLLQNSLLYGNRNMKLQNNLERSDVQKSVLDVLSRLSSNIPIYVEHDSVTGFSNSPQTTLFDYLGATLYHGCIVDEDESLAPEVSKLTPHGLTRLRTELKEKEPSVLVWNGSFLTTIKVEGAMYLLLDDTIFVNEQNHMFWEFLKELKEGGVFMDYNFAPVDSDLSFTILSSAIDKIRKKEFEKEKEHGPGADDRDLEKLHTNIADKESDKDNFYPTKLVNVSNRQYNIILQHKSGPCCLIAICNVLILNDVIILETTKNMVQKDYLIDLLEQYLLQREVQYLEIPAELLAVLPTLASYVTVNVNFHRMDSFDETPPISLFRHLGIFLYHGWLPDPSDDTTFSTVSPYSFDALSAAAVDPLFLNVDKAKEFLMGHQLTNYGLHCLRKELKEEMPCVLFKDGHFFTMMKINGELYALATASIFSEEPVAWERFFEEGRSEFVDSNFIPIGNSQITAVDELSEDQLAWQQVESTRVALRIDEIPAVNVIIIDGVPTERDSTLEAFNKTGNHFAKKNVIFEHGTSVVVAETIIVGRIIALDLLHHIVQSHQDQCSWNGKFNRSKIKVSGGFKTMLGAMIQEAFGVFSRGAMRNDYRSYVKEVPSLFEVDKVGYPAFFLELIELLEQTDLQVLSPNALKIFFKKVLGNLALKAPPARAAFFGGVHRIGRNGPHWMKSDLRRVLMIDRFRHVDQDWRLVVHGSEHPLLLKTLAYTRNEGKPKNDGSSKGEDGDPLDPEVVNGESTKEDADPPDPEVANDETVNEDANPPDPEAAKQKQFGDFLGTLDSCTQFPRQVNEHAGEAPQDGQPYNEPYEHESELDLLYSQYLHVELTSAHELLLTSYKLKTQLFSRLREMFELLDRQEVFPQYARRR